MFFLLLYGMDKPKVAIFRKKRTATESEAALWEIRSILENLNNFVSPNAASVLLELLYRELFAAELGW